MVSFEYSIIKRQGSVFLILLYRPQAFCRGYLKRKDLDWVRTQFEDIVREIDGDLDHLHWKGKIISKPHFTDTVTFHVSSQNVLRNLYFLLLYFILLNNPFVNL